MRRPRIFLIEAGKISAEGNMLDGQLPNRAEGWPTMSENALLVHASLRREGNPGLQAAYDPGKSIR